MNKNNKILLVVLTLIVVMTIGYALFSDKITITGTAKAKGDFSVSMNCGVGDDNQLYVDGGFTKFGGVENPSITCNGTTVISTVTLTRPTSRMWFYVEVENTGTIPFKLKQVENLDDGTIINLDDPYSDIYTGNSEKKVNVQLYPDDIYEDPDDDGYVPPAYMLAPSWEERHFTNVITPGGKQIFYINAWWSSVKDQPAVDEGASVTGRFQLNFEQATN